MKLDFSLFPLQMTVQTLKPVYSSAGVISSPSWPNLRPSVRDCYWKIEVGRGNGIKIAVMDFDIEYESGCEDNKVKIKGERINFDLAP